MVAQNQQVVQRAFVAPSWRDPRRIERQLGRSLWRQWTILPLTTMHLLNQQWHVERKRVRRVDDWHSKRYMSGSRRVHDSTAAPLLSIPSRPEVAAPSNVHTSGLCWATLSTTTSRIPSTSTQSTHSRRVANKAVVGSDGNKWLPFWPHWFRLLESKSCLCRLLLR